MRKMLLLFFNCCKSPLFPFKYQRSFTLKTELLHVMRKTKTGNQIKSSCNFQNNLTASVFAKCLTTKMMYNKLNIPLTNAKQPDCYIIVFQKYVSSQITVVHEYTFLKQQPCLGRFQDSVYGKLDMVKQHFNYIQT